MAREIHRLSSAAVKNAKPGMHADGGGLYLQATEAADGSVLRSWIFRFATGRVLTSASGKPRREEKQMGLGPLQDVGLAERRKWFGWSSPTLARSRMRNGHRRQSEVPRDGRLTFARVDVATC